MDVHNNNLGADVARALTRTVCWLRIGYIFGSFCALRKVTLLLMAPSLSACHTDVRVVRLQEVAPSSWQIYSALYNKLPQAVSIDNPNSLPGSNDGRLWYIKSTVQHMNAKYQVGTWGSCNNGRKYRSVICRGDGGASVAHMFCFANGQKKPRSVPPELVSC